jgi:F-type H+-transporting ATPase subunit b
MISLDWTLFVQMAIFLAFVVYLNTFLLKPMTAYLARRKETIEGLQESGSDQDIALEAIRKDYTQKLNKAHDEMLARRTSARKEALALQDSLLEEAKKESYQELSKGESELQKEIVSARQALEQEARALATAISGKILGRACQ